METHTMHLKKANAFFKTADHLIYVTLPVVNDNKLIVTAVENINLALQAGMNAMLEYERLYKRISPLADNFNSRYEVFKKAIIGKYGFINDEALLILDLKKFVEDRKDAPMEFMRSDKYVICSDNYKMKTISLEEIKKYLSSTKNFLFKVGKVLKNA